MRVVERVARRRLVAMTSKTPITLDRIFFGIGVGIAVPWSQCWHHDCKSAIYLSCRRYLHLHLHSSTSIRIPTQYWERLDCCVVDECYICLPVMSFANACAVRALPFITTCQLNEYV